tara:strand:- start:12639 stop:13058 length:420 start_codon:yes stop_codon:yes gene_type:complete
MRNYIIFCILTLVGGFVWGTAFGQNFDSTPNTDENIYWAAKPVQCGPVKEMFIQMQKHGQKAAFGGLGLAHSENYAGSLNVFNFLAVNMEDNSWVMVEINEDKTLACVTAYGVGMEWNPKQLEQFTSPNTFDNPDFLDK